MSLCLSPSSRTYSSHAIANTAASAGHYYRHAAAGHHQQHHHHYAAGSLHRQTAAGGPPPTTAVPILGTSSSSSTALQSELAAVLRERQDRSGGGSRNISKRQAVMLFWLNSVLDKIIRDGLYKQRSVGTVRSTYHWVIFLVPTVPVPTGTVGIYNCLFYMAFLKIVIIPIAYVIIFLCCRAGRGVAMSGQGFTAICFFLNDAHSLTSSGQIKIVKILQHKVKIVYDCFSIT